MTHAPAICSLALLCMAAGCGPNYRLGRRSPDDGPSRSVVRLRWHKALVEHTLLDFRPQEWASAAFGPAGMLFVGTSANALHAFSARGEELWAIKTHGPVSSRPVFSSTTASVYFGSDDGRFFAADAVSGKLRWTYSTKGLITRPPVLSQGLVFFTTSENRVYALDAATGKWRWQYEREMPEGFTIRGYAGICAKEGLLYTGFAGGEVVALKATSGEVVWVRHLGGGAKRFMDVDTTPVLHGSVVLVASYSAGLHALSLDTGSVKWRFPLTGIRAIAASKGGIFLTASKVGLVALASDGRERWRQALPPGVPAEPLVVGPYVMVSTTESGMAIARRADGSLLQYFSPGYGISAPPASDSKSLAVLSNRGHLYVFDLF